VHDLATVDLIRERMPVSYKAAMAALDEADGDIVGALAVLEDTTAGGLRNFELKAREGVTRGLAGDVLTTIRWRILGQELAEAPVALAGVAAVAVGLLCPLISSSTVYTEYEPEPVEALDS
jgi:hypothetical protein